MDAETAREIGRLETTVASLVEAVKDLTKTVADLRDESIGAKTRRNTLIVASNVAAGVIGFIGSQFGGQITALLGLHAPR